MQVLLITGSYPPMKCGIGAYTQKLAAALAGLDAVRVTVLTDRRAIGQSDSDGVTVLPDINSWRFGELIRIARQVVRLSPDVVHIQYPTQGYTGKIPTLLPLVMRVIGKHCVQTWHEPVLGRGGFWLSIGLDALISVREELMDLLPGFTRKLLQKTSFTWIPAASMLPTVVLNSDERSNIRHRYVSDNEVLLVYYGFVAPLKGLEALLEIVARTKVKLLLACDLNPGDSYHKSLLDCISSSGIASRTTITGFLPDEELSEILAAADAVVLPFRDGAKDCNTSIDGAVSQGSFVLTTSTVHSGYNKDENIYYAKPGSIDEMIDSLEKFAGQRGTSVQSESKWRNIAEQHLRVYRLVSAA